MNKTNPFLKEIQNSWSLFDYPENWDDEGALPLNPFSYYTAMEFLFCIAAKLGDNVYPPEINLTTDGNIDLSWRCPNGYRLLIHVNKGDLSCYGDDGKEKDQIEFKHIGIYDRIDLLDWINKNLK